MLNNIDCDDCGTSCQGHPPDVETVLVDLRDGGTLVPITVETTHLAGDYRGFVSVSFLFAESLRGAAANRGRRAAVAALRERFGRSARMETCGRGVAYTDVPLPECTCPR